MIVTVRRKPPGVGLRDCAIPEGLRPAAFMASPDDCSGAAQAARCWIEGLRDTGGLAPCRFHGVAM